MGKRCGTRDGGGVGRACMICRMEGCFAVRGRGGRFHRMSDGQICKARGFHVLVHNYH